MKNEDYLSIGRRTIDMEAQAVQQLSQQLDKQFCLACDAILACSGKVIVTGMGKSHHIGNKIAATLASTGTPSFFVHAGEASHGDLGMITENDVVIIISYSGNAGEIVSLLPIIKRMSIPLISITGNQTSPLAQAADIKLNVAVESEACPLDLAPTSSTTATLVMGDALAIALLEARGFTAEDFAYSHPGGVLGKRLLVRVEDLMHTAGDLPSVGATASLTDALIEMSEKTLGMTTVVNARGALIGIFTDGDLRRSIDRGIDINTATITEVMNPNPKSVYRNMLAAEALGLMESGASGITTLVVQDAGKPVGVIHLHTILKAGIV